MTTPGKALWRPARRRRCSSRPYGRRLGSLRPRFGALRPPGNPTRRSRSARTLEQLREEAAARGPALCRREEAVLAPALLMQVDECLQVRGRGLRFAASRRARPPRPVESCAESRAAPSCRACRDSPRSRGRPGGSARGRRLPVRASRASGRAAPPTRTRRRAHPRPDRRRRRRRSTTSQREGSSSARAATNGMADGRQVRGRGQDGGVVRVIRGAEEDGRR